MSTKNRWILAGVSTLLVVLAIIFWPRAEPPPDDQSPPVMDNPPPATTRPEPSPESKRAFEQAVASAPADGKSAVPLSVQALQAEHKKIPRVFPYRPARLLAYSEDPVSLDPTKDDGNWALRRIFETLQPDAGEAERIRELWRAHEDGRRFLWVQAEDRSSGPRRLNAAQVARLDAAFESDLLNKVLTPEQGVRLLAETGHGPL